MSFQCGKLYSLILLEYFGETIAKVGRDLFRGGPKPLRLIVASTSLGVEQVCQSLCVLIKYGLVEFAPGTVPHVAEYKAHPEKALLFLRYSKYLMLMKTIYGNEAEIIVEEILRHGMDSPSQILLRSYKRLLSLNNIEDRKSSAFPKLRDSFEVLVKKQYIIRCPPTTGKKPVPEFIHDAFTEIKVPQFNIPKLVAAATGNPVDFDDNDLLWMVNFDRFHQDFRDDLLIVAMSRRVAPRGGEVMRLVLQQMYVRSDPWVATSNPVMVSELKDVFRKAKVDLQVIKYLEDYLAVMADDPSGFLSRADTSAAGYFVNLKRAIEEITWCILASGIDVKFGANAAKIFRLIHEHRYIEQDEIQKKAMLPDKETKLLTYTLLRAGWIQQQELKKALQKAGPAKVFFLFHIDIDQVVRMYIEMCYKSLYNAIVRREHEKMENKCLLDKKQRIDAIALHMRKEGATEEQVTEIEEMVTPPEHVLLQKIQQTVNKLSQAELQIDETLLILQLYLRSQRTS